MLMWVRGKAKQKRSLTFCVFGQTRSMCSSPLPSPSRNLDKAFQRMARLSTHLALPQAVCCHTETGQNFPQLNTTNVTQVAFTFVRHTLEVQVSCLYAGLDLTVGKELFNESQPHIILHLFYTQHCVGKT